MREIAEAEALLAALSHTDKVKSQAARRQRLTQLQVAYGNALIAARGYGAPERPSTPTLARSKRNCIGRAAKSSSSAIRQTPRLREKRCGPR